MNDFGIALIYSRDSWLYVVHNVSHVLGRGKISCVLARGVMWGRAQGIMSLRLG